MELVDTKDLKSFAIYMACEFESRPRHKKLTFKTKNMNFIITVTLITIVIYFFGGGLILNWSAKISGIENFKYKHSLLILFISGIVSFLVRIIFILGFKTEILGSVLALIASFFVFHYFIKKYSQTNWKKNLKIYAIFSTIMLIILFTLPIVARKIFFSPFILRGVSMEPTYKADDYLLINKIDRDFDRNDIIIFKNEKNNYILTRIIGLPKEKIEIKEDKVFINGKVLEENYIKGKTKGTTSLTLKADEYYILGDNREHSFDSRSFGPIKKSNINGKVFYKDSTLMDYFTKQDINK